MGKKCKTTVIFIAVSLSILLVVGLIIWWKPIAIKYHNQRINVLLSTKPKLDPDSGLSFFGDNWIRAFEKHRDKLVELGYLQRMKFPLSNISVPSLESRRLFEELRRTFPSNPHTCMQGYEPNTPAMITVWDQPVNLAEWEKIISAHDVPPANIVDVSEIGELQELLSFVGRWANEDGKVCYIITQTIEGNLKIQTPPNDTWRTIFKNIRLEGKRMMFDLFSYIDPNEYFKSIIDQSGEHPFSGVRCSTVLEVNLNNSNELFQSMSSNSAYFTHNTHPNRAILRRLN